MIRVGKFSSVLFLLLAVFTGLLPFAVPQICQEALREGLVLCGGPLLLSLFPFLVVFLSADPMSGRGEACGSVPSGCPAHRSGQSLRGPGPDDRFSGWIRTGRQRSGRGRPHRTDDGGGSGCAASGLCLLRAVLCHPDGRPVPARKHRAGNLPVCLADPCRVSVGGGSFPPAPMPERRNTCGAAVLSHATAGPDPRLCDPDLPETLRLCPLLPDAGGRGRGDFPAGSRDHCGDPLGSLRRMLCLCRDRILGQCALLRIPQRTRPVGPASDPDDLPGGNDPPAAVSGKAAPSSAFAGVFLSPDACR